MCCNSAKSRVVLSEWMADIRTRLINALLNNQHIKTFKPYIVETDSFQVKHLMKFIYIQQESWVFKDALKDLQSRSHFLIFFMEINGE